MKFRARINNPKNVETLSYMVSTFQKASPLKRCCLRMTPSRIYFTLDQDSFDDESRVWIEIIQANIFDSYTIQSLHPNSEILLQVNIDHIARALRSATTSTELVMRLTKKDSQPYLAFKIGTMTSAGAVRPVHQNIPVVVCPAEDIELVKPPEYPIANVNIYLPDVKVLKNIVERMKAINGEISLRANQEGDFELFVENDIARVKTCFQNLGTVPFKEGQTPPEPLPPAEFVEATINTRRFSGFIQAAQNFSDQAHALMSMTSRVIVLLLLHDDMTLSYFLPIRA